jgi:hypothetical protein
MFISIRTARVVSDPAVGIIIAAFDQALDFGLQILTW